MSLVDHLRSPGPQPEGARRARPGADRASDAGVKYEADGTWLVTLPDSPIPLDGPAEQREAIEALGVSIPEGWRVRVSEMRYDPAAWHRDAQGEDAVTRPVWRYRFVVEPEPDEFDLVDMLDVLDFARSRPARAFAYDLEAGAFVVCYADMQLGKVDADGGSAQIVDTVLTKTAAAVEQLTALHARGVRPERIVLAFLGDCVEGFVSQGGRLAWRTDSTMTQMVRMLRRLVLLIIDEFVDLADHIDVAVIPGNHDQAIRHPVTTTADDSWDVDAVSAVADALTLNVARYGHVAFVFPRTDDNTITLDVAGTIVTLAHGHQFKGGAIKWWGGQATGMTAAGDSTLLLAGHLHHLHIETAGPRTFIQCPALDTGSSWFTQQTGLGAPSGLVTFTLDAEGWDNFRVL